MLKHAMSHTSTRWNPCAVLVLSFLALQVLAGRGRHHHDDRALDRSDVVRLGVTPNGRFRLHLPAANVELDSVQDSDVEDSNHPDGYHDQSEQPAGGSASSEREHSGRQRLTLSKGHMAQPAPVPNSTPLPMHSLQAKGTLDKNSTDVEQQPGPAKPGRSEQPSEVRSETKKQADPQEGGHPENSHPRDKSELEDLGMDNISMQDFSDTDEASAMLAATAIDQAELNLEVIRKFPKMSLWETRLREAISEAGAGARCSDLKDTMFRGYGCGIRDNGQAICTCRGGHEDCQMHDSEDVLDYLWTVKQNKTVDENVMRELLAGRCDYFGGHAVSWFEIGAILGVILTPVVFACICCFVPVVMTRSAFSSKGSTTQQRMPKSRVSGFRQASPRSSAREAAQAAEDAEGSSVSRQPEKQASPSSSERQ